MNDNRSIIDLSREAILLQSACNLSGIVHSFSRAMTRLRELEPNKDTVFYNTHPISVLFSSKIASLTNSENGFVFSDAYNTCKEICGE